MIVVRWALLVPRYIENAFAKNSPSLMVDKGEKTYATL